MFMQSNNRLQRVRVTPGPILINGKEYNFTAATVHYESPSLDFGFMGGSILIGQTYISQVDLTLSTEFIWKAEEIKNITLSFVDGRELRDGSLIFCRTSFGGGDSSNISVKFYGPQKVLIPKEFSGEVEFDIYV